MKQVQKKWDEFEEKNRIRLELSNNRWKNIKWLYVDTKKGDIGFNVNNEVIYEFFGINRYLKMKKWKPQLFIQGIEIIDLQPFEPLLDMLEKFDIGSILKSNIKDNRW